MRNAFDFTPLYRTTVGFDRLANLIDSANQQAQSGAGYPPYNIELVSENKYSITLALAGFKESELDLQTEKGVLTVRGKKSEDKSDKKYLYQGISNRSFERKFQLADHVEVVGASLNNGLLEISLVKEIPEAMKPKKIAINGDGLEADNVIEHKAS